MTMKSVTHLALFVVFVTIDGYDGEIGCWEPGCIPYLPIDCRFGWYPGCAVLVDDVWEYPEPPRPRSRGFSKGGPYRALWTGYQKKGGRYGNNGAGTSWSPYIANSWPLLG